MSAIIAAQPVSIGITAIADRQSRQRQAPAKAKTLARPGLAQKTASAPGDAAPSEFPLHDQVQDTDECLPADTLFTAALIANRLPLRHETADEVMLRKSHDWLPPTSEFQLTDKTI